MAKAIVFGAPDYWDGMNAKGRAFWERICFANRHNAKFPFKDKLGVMIGVSGDGKSENVIADIEKFFIDSYIKVIVPVSGTIQYLRAFAGFQVYSNTLDY